MRSTPSGNGSLLPAVQMPNCNFSLVSSGQIQEQTNPSGVDVQVLIFLYRVNIDPHQRNAGRLSTPEMQPPPLSVDLHYLFTFWSSSAENEHLAVAWTMRELQATPFLDATMLSSEAHWSAEDMVHLVPEELSNEDMMRIWDALKPEYRLSLAYIARVVRIDPDKPTEHRPVVAMRFNYAVPAGIQ